MGKLVESRTNFMGFTYFSHIILYPLNLPVYSKGDPSLISLITALARERAYVH